MLDSCTRMATVGVKWINTYNFVVEMYKFFLGGGGSRVPLAL